MALTDEGILNIPGMLSRWVRLPSGAKAHYMTAGETGPAVVLLHGGLAGSSGVAGWRFMAPFLGANGFRVYCPDFPGFGITENYEGYEPSWAGSVDFLHEFVTAVGLEKFFLGGNSLGCENSVYYAVSHPERLLGLALIAGTVGDLVDIPALMKADPRPPEEVPDYLGFDGSSESMDKMLGGIILDATKVDDDLLTMRTNAARRHTEYYNKFVQNEYFNYDTNLNLAIRLRTTDRFDKLDVPAVYLYGAVDVLLPHDFYGYPQEDVLPNVQFFYPEDTGHQGQTDQPELVNQLFLEFFRDGKVSWDTAKRAGISDRRPPISALVDIPAGESA